MARGVFHMMSWNVLGLYDPSQKILVKNMLTSLQMQIHISMLWELHGDYFRLLAALTSILPNYHQVIATQHEGKGGLALLVHPKL